MVISNFHIDILLLTASVGFVSTSYEFVEGSGDSLEVQISKIGDIEVTASKSYDPLT